MSYYSKPKFTLTNHAIRRYIERVEPYLSMHEANSKILSILDDVIPSSTSNSTDARFITSDGKYEIITTYNFVVKTIIHKK